MVKHLKALALVLACVAIGCAGAFSMPRVVTMVEPYTPILPLDERANPGLDGRVLCDLLGMPVIYIRLSLPDSVAPMVLLHEKIHVEQAYAMGGCRNLRQRISSDSMFRLQMEADAFCGVFNTERLAGHPPHESVQDIFAVLSTKYQAAYDSAAVWKAMKCAPPG